MTTSSANAPSTDIKDLIEDSGSGLGYVFGTDMFIGQLPNSPDNCICLFDTGGGPTLQWGYEEPNLQILLRNNTYSTGYQEIRDIKYFLNNKTNETQGGVRYISINTRSDILSLGQDDNNRYLWSLNFRILRSGI